MKTYIYVRLAHHPPATRTQQAELIRQEAEQRGFEIIDTGCSVLDARLLSLLQKKGSKVQQAVITFGG